MTSHNYTQLPLINKIAIINCIQDTHRLDHIKSELSKLNLDYHVVYAADGYLLSDDIFINKNITLTDKGSRGCALSHIQVWEWMINTNTDNVLILEDDATFIPNFVEHYNRFVQIIPQDYGMIYLGYSGLYSRDNDNDVIMNGVPMCTHAYIMTIKAAKWYLDKMKEREVRWNIDIYMQYTYGDFANERPWSSYCIWNMKNKDLKQYQPRLNVLFNGLVYQNCELSSSIRRD